jgi:Porin subfamily
MKTIKSLVLGSAAGLLAMSGAQAADLPVKAKAVEYVKVCSLYGAGFWYIPGTDTCIKLGGYARVDTTFNGGIYGQPSWSSDLGQQNRYRDYFASRARVAITLDTRTATEYGVVRTFGQLDWSFNGFVNQNPVSLAGFTGSNTQAQLQTVGGGYVAPEFLFIQFAGFTFGKSASAYATPWQGYPGNNFSYLLGGHDDVTGVQNIQYTAQFGNGVSGTIGLDDPSVYNRTALLNLVVAPAAGGTAAAITAGANAYGGTHAPDIVGNIRIDQAWGLFQISGAGHLVNASYNILTASGAPTALSEISGHPDDKWGGSVMAALQIKNLPTGAGDDIKIDASYAKGDTKNVISTSAGSPSFAMFGGTGRAGAYQSIGFGQTADAVYLPVGLGAGLNGAAGVGGTGDIKLVTAYGIRGAFNHNWDPYWSTSVFGSASAVRYGGTDTDITTGKGQWCASYMAANGLGTPVAPGAKVSADFRCNPDFNVFQAGIVTRWTPVKNLTFSGEVGWFGLDQKFTGAAVLTPMAPKPTQVYEFKDQNTVYLNVRVQRNF